LVTDVHFLWIGYAVAVVVHLGSVVVAVVGSYKAKRGSGLELFSDLFFAGMAITHCLLQRCLITDIEDLFFEQAGHPGLGSAVSWIYEQPWLGVLWSVFVFLAAWPSLERLHERFVGAHALEDTG
jgi:hypothetical protein